MVNIELFPGNILSSLHVYHKVENLNSKTSIRNKTAIKCGKHYASLRSVKRRGGKILEWHSIKNQPNCHFSVILSCYKFSNENQNNDLRSFQYNLLLVRRRLQKIKDLFSKKYSEYYVLFAIEISKLNIIHVHFLTNISHDNLECLCIDIRAIIENVVAEYESKTAHRAVFVAPFSPAQISYLATQKKYKETARILGIMNGRNTHGIINKKNAEFHESIWVRATAEQLASIKRYVFYIINRRQIMRNDNVANSHQVMNVHNNNFTQHGLNEDHVQEVMSRSEEIWEGAYNNDSLVALAIEEVLGPQPPHADELSAEERAEDRRRVQMIMEWNWDMAEAMDHEEDMAILRAEEKVGELIKSEFEGYDDYEDYQQRIKH